MPGSFSKGLDCSFRRRRSCCTTLQSPYQIRKVKNASQMKDASSSVQQSNDEVSFTQLGNYWALSFHKTGMCDEVFVPPPLTSCDRCA